MQLCSGTVRVHRRDDVCEERETVQSMSVNANGTILAVVTQLHLHFWSAGSKTVYLTSLLIPDTSLDDNPAMFVLWRPRLGNHLAVVTSRHVVFFEADINLKQGQFLLQAEQQRSGLYLQHVDAASRVCYSSAVRIEAGLTAFAVAAGPYAFLVTTTAGVVYVMGWHSQDVLHQWTTVGLQDKGHVFTSSTTTEKEMDKAAAAPSLSLSSSSPTAAATSSEAHAATAAVRHAARSAPFPSMHRVDPLQRRYQQVQLPEGGQRSFCSEAAPPSQGNAVVVPSPTLPGMAGVTNAPPFLANPLSFASGGIHPPGNAVRSSEDKPFGASPSASPRQTTDVTLNGSVGVDEATATDTLEHTTPLTDLRTAKSSSRLAAEAGIADTVVRGFTDGSGAAGPKQRQATGRDLLSGTILHASFVSRWKVLSFVFSGGAVLLCRPSCGTNFTHSKVQLQGCVTPIVSAHMVAMNMRHLLLAVCTQAGALSCRRIDGSTLAVSATPLWKGLRGLQERFSSAASTNASPQSLGLISAMEWSPSEELLCVAFYKHGMVLVHYSGAVLTHHLSGPASATLLRSPGVAGLMHSRVDAKSGELGSAAIGCSYVYWKPDGTQLWMAAPNHSCFFSAQLSRVLAADAVGPTSGCHTPLTLLADDALYLISVSEATGRQGVRELVLLPEEYLCDQYPLLYGAVSSNGSLIACAGRRGLLIFHRDRFAWKLASKKQEEMAFSCVADPVWLRDIAVAVPALRADTKTYELVVLSTNSVSPSHALARVALEGRPSMLSCVHQDHRSEGYIVMVDCNQIVRVFRYDAFMDAANTMANAAPAKAYVSLTPVQQLVLSGDLASPLRVVPICLRKEEDDRENPQRTKDQVELRLLLHRRGDHALVWIRGSASTPPGALTAAETAAASPRQPASDGKLPHLTATSELLQRTSRPAFVYNCWVDRTSPLRGTVLLTHDEGSGVVLYQLQQSSYTERISSANTATVAVRQIEVAPTRDTELLPLCASPFDGYMICAGTDTSVPRPARRGTLADAADTPAHPQLALRPLLYAHRVLSLLLLTAMPGGEASLPPSSPTKSPKKTRSTSAIPTTPSFSRTASGLASATAPPVSAAEIDGRVASFMWDRALFLWLEQLRLNDTFAAVMDYFLHTALNESPPANVPGLGRRSAIRAVIALLRNYPEFYTIVVGCVRKIDFTHWHLVLDFLGTPTALFRECVAHHCYAEAVHLVRVIMMGSYKPAVTLSVERVAELSAASAGGAADALTARSHSSVGGHSGVGPLEQASQCAIELFGLSIENGDYTAAYDLLRFMALLEDEIGMPEAGGLGLDGGAHISSGGADAAGGASEGFLTRWLRQLTFSGAAYDDPDAAVEETQEDVAAQLKARASGSNGGARETPKTRSQIGSYTTLVLDAARCEPVLGGRSAEEAADEKQRQTAVRHMFRRRKTLPGVVHEEALRLLLTGYVAQLARLLETFSFSVTHFIQAASKLVTLSTAAADGEIGSLSASTESGVGDYTLHLHEVFDGLHKELGLPRSYYVPSTAVSGTAWNSWVVEHQIERAAKLPGLLSATNPKVWTVAQSVLYNTPELRTSVESLHHLFRGIFVYHLAFCVVLMRKSDLISLLLSTSDSTRPAAATLASPSEEPHGDDVSPGDLITVLGHLEALLALPENTGYKPFLQDVFKSLPPSALRAHVPQPTARPAEDAPPQPT